ncbi:uncharacterized protein METZ01_LOCUS60357 [marine metagenome]|uniref:Uncharacterized protein n=1 Tax=marine metagenome TaxID=408172 RepID=A0A381T1H7_9ZZZZ
MNQYSKPDFQQQKQSHTPWKETSPPLLSLLFQK